MSPMSPMSPIGERERRELNTITGVALGERRRWGHLGGATTLSPLRWGDCLSPSVGGRLGAPWDCRTSNRLQKKISRGGAGIKWRIRLRPQDCGAIQMRLDIRPAHAVPSRAPVRQKLCDIPAIVFVTFSRLHPALDLACFSTGMLMTCDRAIRSDTSTRGRRAHAK
jgi:hypothetical protein